MAKAPAPPSSKITLATFKQKIGPLPLWGWAAIAVIAYYVWTRYYGGGAATSETTTSDLYPDTYEGGGGATGFAGTVGGGGGGVPVGETTIPPDGALPEPITGEEPGGAAGHPNRRHRIQRIKRKTGKRIEAIKEGGVTAPERQRIKQIKERRRSRIRKIRAK